MDQIRSPSKSRRWDQSWSTNALALAASPSAPIGREGVEQKWRRSDASPRIHIIMLAGSRQHHAQYRLVSRPRKSLRHRLDRCPIRPSVVTKPTARLGASEFGGRERIMTRTAIRVRKRIFRLVVGSCDIPRRRLIGASPRRTGIRRRANCYSGTRSALRRRSRQRRRIPRRSLRNAARWRLALAPTATSCPGTTETGCNSVGNNCAQGTSPWGTPSSSEDCLFLNIYVPVTTAGSQLWERKLPVMVWIHGGGFTGGNGAAYDPTGLVEEGNVIVVTIDYRLSALGLFAHPALDSEHHLLANYALMDQQLALKWLKRNIPGLGGDPDNITIFGESAGGISIYAHLVSPLASGLFQKAIIESGLPTISRFGNPRPMALPWQERLAAIRGLNSRLRHVCVPCRCRSC